MIYRTLIHIACNTGNLSIINYLISLKEIKIDETDVLN